MQPFQHKEGLTLWLHFLLKEMPKQGSIPNITKIVMYLSVTKSQRQMGSKKQVCYYTWAGFRSKSWS